MFYAFLIALHVLVSLGLIMAVLMQSSKGGGLAGTFGGSGVSGGVFGGRGAAPFLTKATTVLAIMFMLTSLSLNYVKRISGTESVLERTRIENSTSSQPVVTDVMPVAEPVVDAPDESESQE
ncbi:preprotein translocase subunit SecG [Candidatus Latescibacterota bacterium]